MSAPDATAATFAPLTARQAAAPSKGSSRPRVAQWLVHDAPYIAMLLLALVGVIFRLSVAYWIILTPIFGAISIAAGWPYVDGRTAQLRLVYRLALCWGALLLAVYLLYSSGVQGVLNANANALTMMTLLALGTFVAGVQAQVWRICAVGLLLFLAVPGLGWLDQSPLLWTAATVVIIACGGMAWWVTERRPAAT